MFLCTILFNCILTLSKCILLAKFIKHDYEKRDEKLQKYSYFRHWFFSWRIPLRISAQYQLICEHQENIFTLLYCWILLKKPFGQKLVKSVNVQVAWSFPKSERKWGPIGLLSSWRKSFLQLQRVVASKGGKTQWSDRGWKSLAILITSIVMGYNVIFFTLQYMSWLIRFCDQKKVYLLVVGMCTKIKTKTKTNCLQILQPQKLFQYSHMWLLKSMVVYFFQIKLAFWIQRHPILTTVFESYHGKSQKGEMTVDHSSPRKGQFLVLNCRVLSTTSDLYSAN